MANSTETVDKLPVLIVGAGPVGLTMALSLALRGIKFRLIDKLAVRSDRSKALGIHSRTLELLDMLGVVDEFLKIGNKVHATSIINGDKTLVHLCFDEMDAHYPYALMVPQDQTERILTEQLQKHSIEIERQVELVAFEQDANGVVATLKHADGTEEKVAANWLLGCDGAHSSTRHILGLPFEGSTYDEAFATVDCLVEWDQPEDELTGFVGEDGVLFFFPMGNKRYRIVADGPMHSPKDVLTLEEMQAVVAKRCPRKVRLHTPNWLTWFVINCRSVTQYRNGRAFISGDAAHVHSPFMGQGMNTGMHDALNLAWKIELVEKGIAKVDLLDSYQEERHLIGQMLLRNTDAVTKVVTIRNHVAQAIRNRVMPLLASHDVVQQRAWKTLSMLGINYRNSPIVGQHKQGMSRSLKDVGSWLDFGHGPTPGDRAPDGEVTVSQTKEAGRLMQTTRGIKHHLLLFAGLEKIQNTIEMIDKVITEVNASYGEFIDCHVVLESAEDAADVKSAAKSILIDKDGILQHRYGASHSCMYLIRPDSYVGFRSQSVDFASLQDFISRVYISRSVAQASAR